MSYLVAAYIVLWAVSFALVLSMVWRQRRLLTEIEALRILTKKEPRSTHE